MARERRRYSSKDCYHIVLRGKEELRLFRTEQDIREFQYILDTKLEEIEEICMKCCYIGKNHFHAIICAKQEMLTSFCTRISISYAWAYNQRYHHKGAVFEGRFLSEPIDNKREYQQIFHYITHHRKNETWRMNSKRLCENWQEEIYEYPVILDVPADLHRQHIAIFSRIAKKKMEEEDIHSIGQLISNENVWYHVQKEVKRILGVRNDFNRILDDFLQMG